MSPEGNGYVGRSMKRKEDPRMITGKARYVDDITLPGMLHAAIVRSPEAHAAIVSIDASGAQARDDVVAVFTGEDLAESFVGGLPMVWDPPGVEINTPDHWPLKRGEVKHVGDPVAVVSPTAGIAATPTCWRPRWRGSPAARTVSCGSTRSPLIPTTRP